MCVPGAASYGLPVVDRPTMVSFEAATAMMLLAA
jgi:hypothetical protein